MYYVYVLKSVRVSRFYVGYCSDLRKRVAEHNNGVTKSTKGFTPWKLIYYEAYTEKQLATKREKQLKNHAAKADLLVRLGYEAG